MTSGAWGQPTVLCSVGPKPLPFAASDRVTKREVWLRVWNTSEIRTADSCAPSRLQWPSQHAVPMRTEPSCFPGVPIAAIPATPLAARELKPTQVPKPQRAGGKPMRQALSEWRSTREFNSQKLSPQATSNFPSAGLALDPRTIGAWSGALSSSTAIAWGLLNLTGRLPEPKLEGIEPEEIEVHGEPTV
jgi:hypothetical protein